MHSWLSRYRMTLIAMLVVGAIGIWPMLVAPLGRAYVAVCARYLTNAPFGHHYPPLLVGFLSTIVAVLFAGMLVALAREVRGQRRLDALLSRRLGHGNTMLDRVTERLGLAGRVSCTRDTEVYAFCGGFIRPRIYVSRGMLEILTPGELEAVLRHERHHLMRRDPLRYFAADLLSRLAPFFPVLGTMTDRLRIRAELSADRAALGHASVEELASALIKVMRASAHTATTPVVASLSPTDARVAALTGRPISLPLDWRDLAVSVVFATVLIGVASLLE